jgi:tryptophan 2-monooxygenase
MECGFLAPPAGESSGTAWPVLDRPRPVPVAAPIPAPASNHPHWVAWPGADTLYDFHAFIRSGPIAHLPLGVTRRKVAIVGAGAAGLTAAYELLKIGADPVIFEASDRIGGRAHSQPFTDGSSPSASTFAEMGAMRFPLSAKMFFHYVKDVFHMRTSGQFPDPGKVTTRLYFQNRLIEWPAGERAPRDAEFQRIGRDWAAFVATLTEPLYRDWQAGDMNAVRARWQAFIDAYRDRSFYAVLRERLPHWSREDVSTFGTLGIGSGGFGALYQVGFLEILRIIVQMWEEDQQLLPDGIGRLMENFYCAQVTQPDGRRTSLCDHGALHLKTPVRAIERGPGGGVLLHFDYATGRRRKALFPAVIVATTTRCMEMLGLTAGSAPSTGAVISQPVKAAVRTLHMMDSSKLYVRTRTKFWKDNPRIPQTILTDELPRAVYALDYPQMDEGVVLISYTWGDDAAKLLGLSNLERFRLCREVIRKISPEFAEHLEPVGGEILSVDWQNEPYHCGAFKLQYPGQEADLCAAYHQFLTANDPQADTGVYLAGDSVSWYGGWMEGALHTGLNAACAAAKRLGATLRPDSPLSQDPNLYQY